MKIKIYNVWKHNFIRQFILIAVDCVFDSGDGGYVDLTLFNFTLSFYWD